MTFETRDTFSKINQNKSLEKSQRKNSISQDKISFWNNLKKNRFSLFSQYTSFKNINTIPFVKQPLNGFYQLIISSLWKFHIGDFQPWHILAAFFPFPFCLNNSYALLGGAKSVIRVYIDLYIYRIKRVTNPLSRYFLFFSGTSMVGHPVFGPPLLIYIYIAPVDINDHCKDPQTRRDARPIRTTRAAAAATV